MNFEKNKLCLTGEVATNLMHCRSCPARRSPSKSSCSKREVQFDLGDDSGCRRSLESKNPGTPKFTNPMVYRHMSASAWPPRKRTLLGCQVDDSAPNGEPKDPYLGSHHMGFALHVFQVQMLSLARDAAWVLRQKVSLKSDTTWFSTVGKHGNAKHRQTQFCRPATIINSGSFQ